MNGYFDYNATSPARPEVVEAVARVLRDTAGNPSSMHVGGRRARALIERAREQVAVLVGVDPTTIVFTSGATESNNLALRGFVRTHPRAVVAAPVFEHHSIVRTLDALEGEGRTVARLAVDEAGRIDPDELAEVAGPEPCLLAIGAANGETGHVVDIDAALAACREGTLVHVDAAQALGKIRFRMPERAALLAASGHKFGAPAGIGILVVRAQAAANIVPQLTGGPQENGLRAGTENLSGIVGMGEAAERSLAELDDEIARLAALRDQLWSNVCGQVSDALRLTPETGLPNTLTIAIGGVTADVAVAALDLAGFQISTGSACAAGAPEPSHVVAALGIATRYQAGVMRISLGRDTRPSDVDALAGELVSAVARARAAA